MKLLGMELHTSKWLQKQLQAVYATTAGWYNIIREPWGGAWQSGFVVDGPKEITAFSAVFACVTLIAADIAKLGADLMQENEGGVSVPVRDTKFSPFLRVLVKPNRFQTWIQFIEQWVTMKLLYGNVYVLKEREGGTRKMVTALYVLDSQRVTPLVADDGSVWYKLSKDYLSGLPEGLTVPADEVIHDRMTALFHPLVGVSPIYACGVSATMGNRIQANSVKFFGNMSRPSGQLTSPGKIDDETAARLKRDFDEKFGGANLGRVFVGGMGLKYEAMTTIPAVEAQLIEQLGWTVADVARCFHVPLWKIGADKEPLRQSVESLNQTYYSDCLQIHVEAMEACLADGLELPPHYEIEFNLENLLRMDTQARYVAKGQGIKDGWLAPDEVRMSEGYKPVPGGDTPYMQQQNFSLAALAKRDAKDDPFANTPKTPAAAGEGTPALPAPSAAAANDESAAAAKALCDAFTKQCLIETAELVDG